MSGSGMMCRDVVIAPHGLNGVLTFPVRPAGLVLFAHGSGSSRLSPRNTMVAGRLNRAGFATLLFDLLTEEEATDRRNAFDIKLLARRLRTATAWARREIGPAASSIGYFGASTGAAAALSAAAHVNEAIAAIVSRGGRPDLAMTDELQRVRAPTLLIVGGRDDAVMRLNRLAMAALKCEARLEIILGATHLFEEAGALERVADLAAEWFGAHMSPVGAQMVSEGRMI